MSDVMTRELTGTSHSARRPASPSGTLFKAVSGFNPGRAIAGDAVTEPAIESGDEAVAAARHAPSIISSSTEMTGSITTQDELRVHGKIEGDVRASMITVCSNGVVKGDLFANIIAIHGAVEGRIEGRHVLLHAGAAVKGEILHGTLGVDTAAVFEGTVKRLSESQFAIAAE